MTPNYTTKTILSGALQSSQRPSRPLQRANYDRLLEQVYDKLTEIEQKGEIGLVDHEQIALQIARAFECGEHYQGERRLCLKQKCFCREDAMAVLVASVATKRVLERLNAEARGVTFKLPER